VSDQFGRRGHVLDLAPAQLVRLAGVLLSPEATQGQHRRELRQQGLIGRRIHGGQEPLSIGRDDSGQLLAGRIGLGQVVVLDSPPMEEPEDRELLHPDGGLLIYHVD